MMLPIPLLWRARRAQAPPALRYPALEAVRAVGPGRRVRWRWLRPALRAGGLGLLGVALGRPPLGKAATQIYTQGIHIMLAVDPSRRKPSGGFSPPGPPAHPR